MTESSKSNFKLSVRERVELDREVKDRNYLTLSACEMTRITVIANYLVYKGWTPAGNLTIEKDKLGIVYYHQVMYKK